MKKSKCSDPVEQRIGNFSVMMDVNEDGDLQIRVYPIDADGQPWDSPTDVFDTPAHNPPNKE